MALDSETFGPLCAELRRAEANGHHVDRLLLRPPADRSLLDADDVAAVLRHRLATTTARPATQRPARIAGIVPKARGPHPDDVAEALEVRARLIETRATDLAAAALRDRATWIRYLPPRAHVRDDKWHGFVVAVAAYRELHGITSRRPLGEMQASLAQRDHTRYLRRLQRRTEAQAQENLHVAARAVDPPTGPAPG